MNYLRNELVQGQDAVQCWFNHWIAEGFDAIEQRLTEAQTGRFMHGNTPTMADICLVPQVVNAGNFKLDLAPYRRIRSIFDEAMALPVFFIRHRQINPMRNDTRIGLIAISLP